MDARVDVALDPKWLEESADILNASRKELASLRSQQPGIDNLFQPLERTLLNLQAKFDEAFVASDPASKPEASHYQESDRRRAGQNRFQTET